MARRKVNPADAQHSADHHHHLGADYNVGRFAAKQNLGKIIVSEQQTEKVII